MIKGTNITKLFGENGLRSTDISAEKGEMIALSGASGCGKSTLLNIITGMLRPDTGKVLLDGKDISKLSEKKRTALRGNVIGYVMQKNSLLPELTILQNLMFPAYIAGKSPDEKRRRHLQRDLP